VFGWPNYADRSPGQMSILETTIKNIEIIIGRLSWDRKKPNNDCMILFVVMYKYNITLWLLFYIFNQIYYLLKIYLLNRLGFDVHRLLLDIFYIPSLPHNKWMAVRILFLHSAHPLFYRNSLSVKSKVTNWFYNYNSCI
jgi:hypothetical protein